MLDIMHEDIAYIQNHVDFSLLAGKRVLVTGATGLIGTVLIRSMLDWNQHHKEQIHVIAVVRNVQKSNKLFGEFGQNALELIIADVETLTPQPMQLDYIIHGASPTASKLFVNQPVEVIQTAIHGTMNLLHLAKVNQVKGFVYLSSMEVYGTPATDEKITEEYPSNLNPLAVRSCYPESKRMCENLCVAFASEYHVPTRIIRLTQTFGYGVEYQDGRVFAEFARCVLEHRDIVLKTKGETKRCYLYTADAVTAILTALLKGKDGQAYNAANEETYCSIFEMASLVASLSDKPVQVKIEEEDIAKFGYASVFKMNLSTEKLSALGWSAGFDLTAMYQRMMQGMKGN